MTNVFQTPFHDCAGLGPLGYGCAALGNLYAPVSEATAREAIEAAFSENISYFDVAPHYGFGLAEKRLGAALQELDPRAEAIISTKVGRRLNPVPCDTDVSVARQGFISPEPFESEFDYSYDAVMRSFEESCTRLRRDRIDILYVHDLGEMAHGDQHKREFSTFMEGGYRALQELQKAGNVKSIGLGVNEWQICVQAMEVGDFDIMLLAGRYTLLDHSGLSPFLDLCGHKNISVVIGGPYNSGILAHGVKSGRPTHFEYGPAPEAVVQRVLRIETICDNYDVPLAAAALQFPLAHPQVVSVIPGMSKANRVHQAAELLRLPIPDSLWRDLRDQALIPPLSPTP